MWGDELHSWNIAKGSNGFPDLIKNTRYEGHPPVWYTILWTTSKLTTDPLSFQLIHIVIASVTVFLLLFFSPLPLFARSLIPFGYFFLFEYAIISRNYAIGVLLALCLCLIMYKNFRGKMFIYYGLLFLLSNTHLLALVLAGSIHLYFLIFQYGRSKGPKPIIYHILIGAIILLPATYLIFPPSDSGLSIDFWANRWSAENVKTFMQAPLRAFTPIPAWWVYNCWNTHFLMEDQHGHNWLRYLNLLIALALLFTCVYFFKGNKKSFVLFTANLFVNFIIAVMVFPLTRERYAGFIFIGFIVALWLLYAESPQYKIKKWLLITILGLQIPGGIYMIVKDIQLPFSNAYRAGELLKKVPQNERAVTDYWTVNAVNAFSDKELYCIDMEKEVKFILWGQDLSAMLAKPNRYYDGARNLFQKEKLSKIYLISIASPESIFQTDAEFIRAFNVKLIEKIDGAINKGGNLYLYEITIKR